MSEVTLKRVKVAHEPAVFVRCEGGFTFYLKNMPADRQLLINKVNAMTQSLAGERPYFLEVYDVDTDDMHLINTNYIFDIYISERAVLIKEEIE